MCFAKKKARTEAINKMVIEQRQKIIFILALKYGLAVISRN